MYILTNILSFLPHCWVSFYVTKCAICLPKSQLHSVLEEKMESTTVNIRFLWAQPEETLVCEKHLRFQIGERQSQ